MLLTTEGVTLVARINMQFSDEIMGLVIEQLVSCNSVKAGISGNKLTIFQTSVYDLKGNFVSR